MLDPIPAIKAAQGSYYKSICVRNLNLWGWRTLAIAEFQSFALHRAGINRGKSPRHEEKCGSII